VPGETSREDVLMTLGVPTLWKCDDQVFMYMWSRKAASILLLPLPVTYIGWGGGAVISSNGRKITYSDGPETTFDNKLTRLAAIEFAGDRFKRYVFVLLPLESKEELPIRVPGCGELDEFINSWIEDKP
jgi:hypothetical protein